MMTLRLNGFDLDLRSSPRARVSVGGLTNRFTPSWCDVIAGVEFEASPQLARWSTVRGIPLAGALPSLNSQRHGES